MHCNKRRAWVSSLDHLVGEGKQLVRHLEAGRFRSFEVDHQLELRGLHYGQIGWLGTVENLPGIDTNLTVSIARLVPEQ